MGSAQLSPAGLGAEVLDLRGEYGGFWTSLIQIHPPSFRQPAMWEHPDPGGTSVPWYLIAEQSYPLCLPLSF